MPEDSSRSQPPEASMPGWNDLSPEKQASFLQQWGAYEVEATMAVVALTLFIGGAVDQEKVEKKISTLTLRKLRILVEQLEAIEETLGYTPEELIFPEVVEESHADDLPENQPSPERSVSSPAETHSVSSEEWGPHTLATLKPRRNFLHKVYDNNDQEVRADIETMNLQQMAQLINLLLDIYERDIPQPRASGETITQLRRWARGIADLQVIERSSHQTGFVHSRRLIAERLRQEVEARVLTEALTAVLMPTLSDEALDFSTRGELGAASESSQNGGDDDETVDVASSANQEDDNGASSAPLSREAAGGLHFRRSFLGKIYEGTPFADEINNLDDSQVSRLIVELIEILQVVIQNKPRARGRPFAQTTLDGIKQWASGTTDEESTTRGQGTWALSSSRKRLAQRLQTMVDLRLLEQALRNVIAEIEVGSQDEPASGEAASRSEHQRSAQEQLEGLVLALASSRGMPQEQQDALRERLDPQKLPADIVLSPEIHKQAVTALGHAWLESSRTHNSSSQFSALQGEIIQRLLGIRGGTSLPQTLRGIETAIESKLGEANTTITEEFISIFRAMLPEGEDGDVT